ncbi:DEAD/DEAH box helicase [Candidatus Laterigemmans baculatus]|uniref:DEAD/DEAH box helicase n=1 Tax=Candidatus Laterigemmans baculatus TaxID=2770505 RepID=UPI0013DCAE7F|nr:DEAD/DEAH box helicase [Candidatus Laterigemmans baculatus]
MDFLRTATHFTRRPKPIAATDGDSVPGVQVAERAASEPSLAGEASPPLEIVAGPSWFAGEDRALRVDVETLEVALPEFRAIPVRLRDIPVKTTGFQFPESPAWGLRKKKDDNERSDGEHARTGEATAECDPARAAEQAAARQAVRKKLTRLRPPRDIVKLQDRLYYLLQPPLEQLVGSGELTFPFEPFPYQFDGIAFLFPRYAAVLADEMGLGKTMQAISTMRMLLFSGEVSSILLVCPKPLVTNWQRELRVWAPEVPVAIIEGDANRREWLWRNPAAPVKIANYELLMRDRELILEGGLHFDLVALDEAQRIKNRNSTTSEIARAIPRTRSWALTGTPVENSPEDLVGIFEFLSPGYLTPDMNLRTIAQAAGDYILRRTKDMVLDDMPPKMYRDADLDLTPEQWATYEKAEKEGVVDLQEMEQELTIQHVFELVLRLKQICNFDPVTGASSKLERLVADMEEIAASGHKAIVFSQWVNSIDQMRPALERFNPVEYHGRIPHKKRDGVIDRFKNDPECSMILMSYGAGSVGLNLQFCQYVFLFDRWWNPAIEDQAINRAHRIGAAGPVTVTRMLAMNTIEQRIADVLDMKRQMFDAIFSDADGPKAAGGLTREEIFSLFNLKTRSGKKIG